MMRPEYGYATKGCKLPPPQGCSRDADYLFDMHLVNWVAKDSVRVANDEGDVYKVSMSEPDSWETPRPPFEVRSMPRCSCTAPSRMAVHGITSASKTWISWNARLKTVCELAFTGKGAGFMNSMP